MARSRYCGSMYFSHRSAGSKICPSASTTGPSFSVGIIALLVSTSRNPNVGIQYYPLKRDSHERRFLPGFAQARPEPLRPFDPICLLALTFFGTDAQVSLARAERTAQPPS